MKFIKFLIFVGVGYYLFKWFRSNPIVLDQPKVAPAVPQIMPKKDVVVRTHGHSVRTYDNQKHLELTNPDTYEIQAGTCHSYSYEIIGADCDITIDDQTIKYADGSFGSKTAGTTWKQKVIFAPEAGCTVKLTIVY